MFIKSSIVTLALFAATAHGQVRPQDVKGPGPTPVCAIEANGAGNCGLWRQRFCKGNCNFEERTINGFGSCAVKEVDGPSGCGCGKTDICKCALNGLEYNIGNYCNANTRPISTVPDAPDEAPPAPETATREKIMIKAAGTNYCLDMRNDGNPKNDVLVIDSCDKDELSQIFIVESRDKGEGDIVKFRSFLEPELCLQTISDIARKRTLIQLGECAGLTNEAWRLENRGGTGAIRSLPLGQDAKSFCLVPRGLPETVGENSGMVLKKCKKAINKGMIFQYTLEKV